MPVPSLTYRNTFTKLIARRVCAQKYTKHRRKIQRKGIAQEQRSCYKQKHHSRKHQPSCLTRFPGDAVTYSSADNVLSSENEEGDRQYLSDMLNTLTIGSALSNHKLTVKVVFSVMLVRNIDPFRGYINSARYMRAVSSNQPCWNHWQVIALARFSLWQR